MKLQNIVLVMFVLLSCSVLAWQDDKICDTSTDCPFVVYAVNSTNNAQAYTDANCSITITNINTTVLVNNVSMDHFGGGGFNYSLNSDQDGDYGYSVLCGYNGETGRETGLVVIGTSAKATITTNQATILAEVAHTWNYLTNGTMWGDVWSDTTRTLTAFNWNIFSNWGFFNRMFNANQTIEYEYNSSRFLMNVTYTNLTDSSWPRVETYNYDNASYLLNASTRSS